MGIVLNQSQKIVLQQIINSINEGIILISSDSEIIYYNNKYADMFNIPDDLMQNKDLEGIKDHVRKMLLKPEQYFLKIPKAFTYKHQVSDEVFLKDGRCFIRLVTPLEIFELKCLLFSFREITKEKRYEYLIKENQKKYQKLLNNIPDLVLLHNNNSKCVYANSAVANFLGYNNPKELFGMDLKSFLTKDANDVLKDNNGEMMQEFGSDTSLELKVVDRNNNPRWLKLISCTKFQQDRDLWMSIFRDITEEKLAIELQKLIREREEKLEEKLKQDQYKYDFFTNLSHELKTPINIISATSYMLEVECRECSPKGKKYIDIIDTYCKRLTRGVNNFIDLEKIETGYFIMNPEICNIIKIIEDITQSVIPYTDVKEIELEFDTDIEEKFMKIDINSLERVVLNLLSNAIKFTKPKGKIQVILKDIGKEIEISIKDTGIGISQEKLTYIFERFRQGDQSPELNPQGSGLGLYLVKNLVELMGGRIYTSSELGKGSVFTVILPANTVEIDRSKVVEKLPKDSMQNNERINMELSDL